MATTAHICVSPSAAQRLGWCAAALRTIPRNAPLCLIVPSLTASERLMMHTLVPGEARFAWQRRTLDELALALALPSLARDGRALLRGPASVLLAQRALARVALAGELGRFAQIGLTPGFAQALHATLGELRLADVDSVALSAHDRTLAALLAAYERELAARALCDRADLFARAAAVLAAGEGPPWLGQLMAFDVALVHRAEGKLFELLAQRAHTSWASVVHGDERSEAYVRQALVNAQVSRLEPTVESQLDLLKIRLFASESAIRAGLVENVRFVTSPGEAREAVEAVRGLLERAAEGVPFDRMAIVLRAGESYRAVMEEALVRAELPAYYAEGLRRPRPEGRALLALLGCAREGVSLDGLCEYLSLAVAPRLLGLSARRTESVLRSACVGASIDELCPRLRSYADAQLRSADLLEEEHAEVAARIREDAALALALAEFLPGLIAPLRALAGTLSFSDALAALSALSSVAFEDGAAVDDVLEELAPLASDDGLAEPAKTDAGRLAQLLGPRLAQVLVPSKGRASGKVFVGAPADLRGLSFDCCFVLGLSEQLFPQRPREDALLSDAQRQLISPDLTVTEERVHGERVLLRLAVGAAEHALTLSFPRFDPLRGRPRVPSFYGLEVLQAIDGVLPAFDALTRRAAPGAAARMGFPAPEDPARAVDDAEYDLAMLGQLQTGTARERTGAARYLLLAQPHLARALRFRARRWSVRQFSPADGFVASDEALRAFVAQRALAVHPYAPTTLEALTRCPYRFYLQAFVGLRPSEQKPFASGLTPQTRGTILHAVQARLLRQLCASGPRETAYARADEAETWLSATLAQAVSEQVPDEKTRQEPLVRGDLDELRRDLSAWLALLRSDAQYSPLAMEFGFGLRKSEDRDPRSTEQPVALEDLTLRGAIDLVEVRGGGERPRLRISDTKSGAFRAQLGTLSGGHSLQPVLYALAAERLFPDYEVEGARLSFCTTRGEFKVHDVPLDPRARAIAADFVRTAGALIASGALYAAPEREGCAQCGYRSVCGPYEEERIARVKVRDLERLAQLHHLRSLP